MFVTTAHSSTSSKYEYEKMEAFQDKPKTDIMFVVDCTGSMEGELKGIKDTIIDFAYTSKAQEVQMRLGLVEFRDRLCGEEHYIHTFNSQPFTNDATLFSTEVVTLQAEGGCGHKASSLDAILFALRQPFTTQGNKVIVLFTDALPRIPDVEAQTVEQVAQAIRNAGVQLYIVKREVILGTLLGLSYLWLDNEKSFDNNVYYKLLEGTQGKIFGLGYSDDFRNHAEELKRTLMNVARTINVNVKSQSYQRGYEDGKASWSLTSLPLGYYFGSSDYWHGYKDGRNYYTESNEAHTKLQSTIYGWGDDFLRFDCWGGVHWFIPFILKSDYECGYDEGYQDGRYHYFSKTWSKLLLESNEYRCGYWCGYISGRNKFYKYDLPKHISYNHGYENNSNHWYIFYVLLGFNNAQPNLRLVACKSDIIPFYLTFGAIDNNKHENRKNIMHFEKTKKIKKRYQMQRTTNSSQNYEKLFFINRLNFRLKLYWCEPRIKKRRAKAYTHLFLTAWQGKTLCNVSKGCSIFMMG